MMPKRTIAVWMTLPFLWALDACGGERPEAEPQEVARATYELHVTNPMPHAMIIFADYGNEEKAKLGRVEPMGTQSFTLVSPPSTSVLLSATDEEGTHEVSGEVALVEGMATRWTVGQK